MNRDPESARALAKRLRDGIGNHNDQRIAAEFVDSWLVRWEREQLERAGQLRLIA